MYPCLPWDAFHHAIYGLHKQHVKLYKHNLNVYEAGIVYQVSKKNDHILRFEFGSNDRNTLLDGDLEKETHMVMDTQMHKHTRTNLHIKRERVRDKHSNNYTY